MAQIALHVLSEIQKAMIEKLQDDHTHAMVLFGWYAFDCAKKPYHVIEPMIIISDDMPKQEEFIKEFYQLLDKYINLKKVKEYAEKTGQLEFK